MKLEDVLWISITMHEFSIEILAPAWHEIEEIADMHLSLVGPASAKK